jgi:hypothetical protein
MKKLNEGGTETGKMIIDTYNDECSELYQKMMKSLNLIKILKIEIDKYTTSGDTSSDNLSMEKRETINTS